MNEPKDLGSHERLRNMSLAELKELREQAASRGKRTRPPAVAPQSRGDTVPPSYAQERLWFLDQLGLVGPAYNMCMAVTLKGELDVAALEHSFAELCQRHETLRTRIATVGDTPQQVIAPVVPFALFVRDLSSLEDQEKVLEVHRLSSIEVQHPFDLAVAPLWRVSLLKTADHEHVLLLTMHHIVSDGWSLGVLNRELGALYAAHVRNQPLGLKDLAIQYADYAIWQRQWLQGDALRQQLEYWKQRLHGAPQQLDLPTDRPRPAVASFRGALLKLEVPAALSVALKEVGRRQGATLFMVLLAAFQVLLARWSGQQDIVVGAPIAGRTRQEFEGLIGFFVNTLALRTDVAPSLTFGQLLEQVKDATLGAYAHQDLPFEALVKELRPERSLARQPIFQVALALQNYAADSLELPGLTWSRIEPEDPTTHFDLTLYLHEHAQGLSASFEYATDLFERTTIERMAGHFCTLLGAIVANPESPIQDLSLLSESEKRQVLVAWNATASPYPRESCVHELFALQAERAPESPALVLDDQVLTYRELNERANRLAHRIIAMGICADTAVGVCTERSIEMIVAFLAILKAGGAYLPLDPTYPPERLVLMLEEARVSVVATTEAFAARLPADADLVYLDHPEDIDQPATNPTRRAGAENLAYVLYTSGSTGRPKAVGVVHRNIVRLLVGTNYIDLSSVDVLVQLAPAAFDASTFEIWGALLHGGKLVLYPDREIDLEQLRRLLERHRVSVLWLTTGLFHQVIDECPDAVASVKWLLTGGEVLSVSHASRALRELRGCRLVNAYGPTEATTFSTCFPMTDLDSLEPAVPIGRPIANTQVYVLDQRMQPVPPRVAGELYIGGDGIARGYLNRPDLTAERFVPDPFGAPGARLYRTGDLVRWRHEGTLEFLGRIDDQIKIRGHRIEPAEIEAVLREHAAVRQAVVSVREDIPGERRLVAHFVADEGQRLVPQVRDFLKKRLPEYMIPSAWVALDQLPLTANGKVDRRALPAPQSRAADLAQYVAPPTELERTLAQIWAQVLRVERVGVGDNFFELGGHSLLATQLAVRIRSLLSIEMPIRAIFECPVLEQLAARVEELRRARVLKEIASGGDGIADLVDEVVSMSASKVEELIRHLNTEGRP